MVKQWKKSLDGDDVQAEAEDALEKDISQMSPASNSVAANLDGGVAAVNWPSTTAINTETTVSFFSDDTEEELYNLSASAVVGFVEFRDATRNLTVEIGIDGNSYLTSPNTSDYTFDLFILTGVGSNLTLTKVAGDDSFDENADVTIEVDYALV
jgi:hypothetical protein